MCSSERSLSSLWVAWILHAIFTGGRGGSQRASGAGSQLFFCFFYFLRCLFENTAAEQFAAFFEGPALKKQATDGSRPKSIDRRSIDFTDAQFEQKTEAGVLKLLLMEQNTSDVSKLLHTHSSRSSVRNNTLSFYTTHPLNFLF